MVMATGIMIAMIDIGPRPGSMPMNVPIRQPPITIRMFCSEKAVDTPRRMPSSMAQTPMKNGSGRRKMPSTS